MMKRILTFLCLGAVLCAGAQPGDSLRLSLTDAVAMARVRSVQADAALDELRSAYWQYRTFRAELLPEISFSGTIPSYAKRYANYQNADGTYSFVRDDNVTMNGALTLSQRIWPTGGTLSLTSSLEWVRQLGDNAGNSFMSIPVALTLSQPLFAANDIKWNRKIEPVRYAEACSQFMCDTEELAMSAIDYYFRVLLARDALDNSRQNLANSEKLYRVAIAKREMGQISENDVLQIELSLLQARSSVASDESTLRSYTFQLASFLGIEPSTPLSLESPDRLPDFSVDFAEALDYAHRYNPLANNQRRRQLEADYDVAKARGNMRDINIFAQVGYTGTDNRASGAYRNLRDNQVVEVGVSIPLLDWGKRRAAVKVAESKKELVANTLRKEAMDFNSNLFVLVERFNKQREQLHIAERAAAIAKKRYETNVETFMVGRISTLDLNDSRQSKDAATQTLLNELYYYWSYYYQLRSITLYDFASNRIIEADIEAALRQLR